MSDLPEALAELVEDFSGVEPKTRIQLLVEISQELPALPADLQESAMEPVPECQSPLFLSVDGSNPDAVKLYFSAPPEAPTTRGFAAILHQGLNGQSRDTILALPDDLYTRFGLAEVISPLRLRGLAAMIARVKHQLS